MLSSYSHSSVTNDSAIVEFLPAVDHNNSTSFLHNDFPDLLSYGIQVLSEDMSN